MARKRKGKRRGPTPRKREPRYRDEGSFVPNVGRRDDPWVDLVLRDAAVAEVGSGQRAVPVVASSEDKAEQPIEEEASLAIPTIALRSLVAVAREEGLENLLRPGLEHDLANDGQHVLTGMRRVFNPDGSEFVRARVGLMLRSGVRADVLDFPTRYIGMLLDASVRREEVPAKPPVLHRWKAKKPTWMGSYSFDKVWRQAEQIADEAARHGPEVSPRGLHAISAIRMLGHEHTHLVRIEREQVEVLPDWEGMGNLWDYVQDLQLPFKIVYLDFEGPGGFAPIHHMEFDWDDSPDEKRSKTVRTVQIRGALLWRDLNDRLVCSVVAWPTGWDLDQPFFGSTSNVPWSDYEIGGTVIFGGSGPFDSVLNEIGETEVTIGDDEFTSRPLGISTALITREKLPGFVQLPVGAEVIGELGGASSDLATHLASAEGKAALVAGWGAMLLAAAARALAALSILEAQEVEIVEAPIETRDRRRAEKRGWNIAKMVVVRPSKKYLHAKPPSGEEARYSHRFWVRAHVKHFSLGTRTADARPDLCKPCHRCGTCRRVNTPAFIKGPPDRPLVPKSLVVQHPRPREVVLPGGD